jgi:hypothetical protein
MAGPSDNLVDERRSGCCWCKAHFGALNTLYYHEYRLKLAQSAHTRVELRLHAVRDFAYAIIIGSLGFVTWRGAFAWASCFGSRR